MLARTARVNIFYNQLQSIITIGDRFKFSREAGLNNGASMRAENHKISD